MKSANATNTTPTQDELTGDMIAAGIAKVFDSVRDRFTTNIDENGEKYLRDAVAKIKKSTEQVVAWAKDNPVKTALAVTTLAAVSILLVKSMNAEGAADDPKEKNGRSDSTASSKKKK